MAKWMVLRCLAPQAVAHSVCALLFAANYEEVFMRVAYIYTKQQKLKNVRMAWTHIGGNKWREEI